MEALPTTEGAEEVQLVRELLALVQQVSIQKTEDRGTARESHGRRGTGAEGERTDMVR